MASLSMLLPSLDHPPAPTPVKIEKSKLAEETEAGVDEDLPQLEDETHGDLVINADNQTESTVQEQDEEVEDIFDEGPGENARSRSCQSATWDELAIELVLEVVTQQVTKVRGVQQGTGESCFHLDGMTWKDIVSMIVTTHNKTCKHTGVTLTHNMVGMTSSVAPEAPEDDGPPSRNKMVDGPDKPSPVKRKRQYKPRLKRIKFDDQSRLSNGMTEFESQFQKTVESILTGQVPDEAENNENDTVADTTTTTTAIDLEEVDIEIVQCPECKRWFKSRDQLKKHKPMHDPDTGPHKCEHCEVTFPTEWDLQKHIPAAHPDESEELATPLRSTRGRGRGRGRGHGRGRGPRMRGGGRGLGDRNMGTLYKCDSCDNCFRTLGGLERHQEVHVETIITVDEGNIIGKLEVGSVPSAPPADMAGALGLSDNHWNYKCQVCKEGFRSKMLLGKHMEIHSSNNGEHKCPECNKPCRTQWNLQRHLLIHRKIKKHKCTEPNCTALFGIKLKLEQHKAKVHNIGEAFTCPTCNSTYKNKVTLKYHMMEHDSKDFICNYYNKKFTRPDALRLHQAHHKPKKFNCTLCPRAYPFRSLLVRHWQNTHWRENTISCQYCDMTFPNYYQKAVHEESHTGVRLHVCDTCGKGFHQKSSLTSHEKLHTDERPFPCAQCDKSFRTKLHMERHMKLHANVNQDRKKLYHCSYCNSSFHWKHQWQDHENRHKGIKPHKCPECEMCFVAGSDLTRHLKVHMGNVSYRCAYCSKSFMTKAAMEKHEMEEHLQFEMPDDDDTSNVVVFKIKKEN